MSYTGNGIDLDKFNKFNKNVELKSEVIELGIVDDIEKDFSKYSKSVINGNAKVDQLITVAKTAMSLYQQAIKDFSLVQKQIDYVKKQAIDLGVDVPQKIKAIENEMKSAISYMDTRIKRLSDTSVLNQK